MLTVKRTIGCLAVESWFSVKDGSSFHKQWKPRKNDISRHPLKPFPCHWKKVELFIRRVQDEGTALATEGPSTDRPLLCLVFLAIYHIRQMHTQTCTLQHMHAHLCTQWIQKKVWINRASRAEMRARWQFRIKYFHSAAGSNKMPPCFTVTLLHCTKRHSKQNKNN